MKLTWMKKLVTCTGKCFQLVYSLVNVRKMINIGDEIYRQNVKKFNKSLLEGCAYILWNLHSQNQKQNKNR